MNPNALDFDYKSGTETTPGEFDVILELTGGDPAVAAEFERILNQYGYKATYDPSADELKLHTSLEGGSTIGSKLQETQRILEGETDPGKKIDVNYINNFPNTPGDVQFTGNKPLVRTKILGAAGKLLRNNQLQQLGRKAQVEQIINDTKNLSSQDIRELKESSVSDASIDGMLSELGLGVRSEKTLSDLMIVLEAAVDSFDNEPEKALVLDIIISRVDLIIFRDYRVKEALNTIEITPATVPPTYDFRKIGEVVFKTLFKNYFNTTGLNSIDDFDDEGKKYYAEIFREILGGGVFAPGSPERKLIEIFAMPVGQSALEIGSLPIDRFENIFYSVNSSKSSINRLARFLNLPETNSTVLMIYRNFKVLSILRPKREKLLDVIFNENLDTRSQDEITKGIFELTKKRIPEFLNRNYANQQDALLYGEATAYLQYLYADVANPTLKAARDAERASFLAIFQNRLVSGSDPGNEVFVAILEVMRSGGIVGFDEKNLADYRIDEIANKLTGQADFFALPQANALDPAIHNQALPNLRVSLSGDYRDSQPVNVTAAGNMPELVDLYKRRNDIYAIAPNIEDLREGLNNLIDTLKRRGLYQYIVALLNNSNNPDQNAEKIFQIIYHLQPPFDRYLNDIAKFIGDKITITLVNKADDTKYLASKLVVDILTSRTTRENVVSRAAYPVGTFGNINNLVLSTNAKTIVSKYVEDNQLRIDRIDEEDRLELIRELKLLDFKRKILELLRTNHGAITPEERKELVDNAIEVYMAGEKENRKLRKLVETELYRFIGNVLTNTDPITGINVNAADFEKELTSEIDNLYAILGKKSETLGLAHQESYGNLDKMLNEIEGFIKIYKNRINAEQIDMIDDQKVRDTFAQFITKNRTKLAGRKADIIHEETRNPTPSHKKKLNDTVRNLKTKPLQKFIQDWDRRVGPPGLLGVNNVDNLANLLAFLEIMDNGMDLANEDYVYIYELIKDPPHALDWLAPEIIETVNFTPAVKLDIAKKFLKKQLKHAIAVAEAYDQQEERLEELIPKYVKTEAQTNTGQPVKVTVGGTNINISRGNLATKVAKGLVNVVTARPIRNAVANLSSKEFTLTRGSVAKTALSVIGGAAAGGGVILTGSAPLILAAPIIAPLITGLVAMGAQKRRMVEDAQKRREMLRADLMELPEEIRTHTQNLIYMQMAENAIVKVQDDLERINKNIYPAIKKKLDKASRDELNRDLDLLRYPYSVRALGQSILELQKLMDPKNTKLDANTLGRKITELINRINEIMIQLIGDLEKLDNRTRKKRTLELTKLEEDYIRVRAA